MKRVWQWIALLWLWIGRWLRPVPRRFRHRDAEAAGAAHHARRKPDWVRQRLLWRQANDPHASVRDLRAIFNRRYGPRVTVSATFVWTLLKAHQAEIRLIRRELKRRPHRATPSHRVWGLDLCGKADDHRQQHPIFGILDHGPRACIALSALRNKTSAALLLTLLEAIDRFGKPQVVRTDNEACFTSRLFRFGLWLLGIRHQRIDLHCPWQNGRIERFFGTLKAKLDRLAVADIGGLNQALVEFRLWYNHVRPHRHLGDLTPAEAWAGQGPGRRAHRFEAWEGLLTGYYHPPD